MKRRNKTWVIEGRELEERERKGRNYRGEEESNELLFISLLFSLEAKQASGTLFEEEKDSKEKKEGNI